jgi:hypothetical protein
MTPDETSPKRARTKPELSSLIEPTRDLTTRLGTSFSVSQLRHPRSKQLEAGFEQTKLASSSEPTSRVMSPVPHTRNSSLPIPSRRRMRFDGIEVPTYRQRSLRTLPPVVQDKAKTRSPVELSDDFDSWEASLDISDLRSLRHGDVSGMSTILRY